MKELVTGFRQDLSHVVDLLEEIYRKLEDADEIAYVYNCNDDLSENEYRSALGDVDDVLEDTKKKVALVKHMLEKHIGGLVDRKKESERRPRANNDPNSADFQRRAVDYVLSDDYKAILKKDAERRMKESDYPTEYQDIWTIPDFIGWCWKYNAGHWPDGTPITDD